MLATLKAYAVCALLFTMGAPAMALAQPGPGWDWRGGPGPWHMWGGWGFGWIFPLLMIVFMIALCVFLMSRVHWGHDRGPFHGYHAGSALQILSERFAKGEISKEEFEEKRAILVRRT
jgi:putative membrane protein